jgi:menaquinone-dependent protoporphyrinogen oxidase
MSPRILVLYGTTDGHTAKVADAITAHLRACDADVDLAHAGGAWDPDPRDYAAVIVAASVHAGTYQRPVRRWARAHAAALGERPAAFVSVCLAALKRTERVNKDLAAIFGRFTAETAWSPTETKVVAGALKYTKYNWFKRWMMRRIVAKAGGDTDTSRDYEYTDWKDLEEFVTRFVEHVHDRQGMRPAMRA